MNISMLIRMTRVTLPGDKVMMNRIEKYQVFYRDGRVFKRQPKHLADNEYGFLMMMQGTGYVPGDVRREDVSTVSMEYVRSERITDIDKWRSHGIPVLETLKRRGIRHGDLTVYSVLVRNNAPVLIDFAESRWIGDPLPDKRPEGDLWWLSTTMTEMSMAALVEDRPKWVHGTIEGLRNAKE